MWRPIRRYAPVERLREQGMSIDELAQLFRMSKSGTWKRVKHIQPKTPEPSIPNNGHPQVQTPVPPLNQTSTSQTSIPLQISDSIEDGTDSTFDDPLGEYDEINQGLLRSPVPPVVFSLNASDPRWQDVILSIVGSARVQGVRDPFEYYHTTMLDNEKLADLVRTIVPGPKDFESLTRNLTTICRKALAYDRNRRDSGLDEEPNGREE